MKKPEWLKIKFKNSAELHDLKKDLRCSSLHTVCESARCPNIHECFGRKTATFMIMGDICTRNCGFCAVSHGIPGRLDSAEPQKIAEMTEKLGLRHVVVTSVTRDDLPDGGATHFAATIRAIRSRDKNITIEVLTPDFFGKKSLIDIVIAASPGIFNHNIETVRRITPLVRSKAEYDRSLDVLRLVACHSRAVPTGRQAGGNPPSLLVKSGIMVGLGETDDEILETIMDLKNAGADILTIGQYLQPTKKHLPVERFVDPEKFKKFATYGEGLGIKKVFSGPLVRSSYMAENIREVLTCHQQ